MVFAILFFVGLCGFSPVVAVSQDAGAAAWSVVEQDGGVMPWPAGVPTPDRPGMLWRSALTAAYAESGYFGARVDSVLTPLKQVVVAKGVVARVSAVNVEWSGESVAVPRWIEQAPLTQRNLELLGDELLFALSTKGFLAATSSVVGIEKEGEEYRVHMTVHAGMPAVIQDVIFEGDTRSVPAYRLRVSGVRTGMAAQSVNLDRIRRRVAAAPGIRRARQPVFELLSDSTAVIVVPVEPVPPGQFDLTVGLLPATDTRGAALTGGGHIRLMNAFGAGRIMEIRLDRRPGQVSAADVRLGDPMILGSPVGLDVAFQGLQQDSTYAHRSWSAGVGYRFDEQLRIGVRWNREVTRPGQAGRDIPRANAAFAGVELGYTRLDDPIVPRSGLELTSLYERGQRSLPTGLQRVERLSVDVRTYFRTGGKGVMVTGGNARLIRGPVLDQSQLVRFGGASSLRGYDEDRFLVDTAIRATAEWRYVFEASSYVFSFLDVGLLERRETETAPGFSDVKPGLGVGMLVETAAGWVNLTYAVNTEESIRNGRIHIGLAFGL